MLSPVLTCSATLRHQSLAIHFEERRSRKIMYTDGNERVQHTHRMQACNNVLLLTVLHSCLDDQVTCISHNIAMQVQYPHQDDGQDCGLTNSMGHVIMLLSNC